jgi:BirA family biotin operon repressor/biotin-[acetyl-CoA-carboxylase] ligase
MASDLLTEARLREALGARPFRFEMQVDSTNDIAREWALNGAPSGSVVLTEEQLAGRGRFGRKWSAPPGTALLMSVILRPRITPEHLTRLTMVGAVSVVETLETPDPSPFGRGESESPNSLSLKWPNDVLLAGRKVAGILPEAIWQGQSLAAVILGIGLNVRVDFAGTELENRSTSIEQRLGITVDRALLLSHLLQRIDYWAVRVADVALLDAWRSRLVTLGQRVTARGTAGIIDGLAVDVDNNGGLVLRSDDGTIHHVVAGEVTLSESER